jgi:hypothetical protein
MELNVLVGNKVPQPARALWPDDKRVFHVTEPAYGLGSSVERHLLEVLHEEAGDNWRGGKHIVTLSICSQNWPANMKYEDVTGHKAKRSEHLRPT